MDGIVLGALGGGIAAALVTFLMLRQNEMQDLLSRMLAIQACKEAWILDGRGWEVEKLSRQKDVPIGEPSGGGLWLRKVEVRAVLDDFQWNQPEDQFYKFLDGRRTWIVRDCAESSIAYSGGLAEKGRKGHPALISSRGFEELATWIERATSDRTFASLWLLSSRGLDMIKPLICALYTKDRREAFGKRLTQKAHEFLEQQEQKSVCRTEYSKKLRKKLYAIRDRLQQTLRIIACR